MSNYLQLRLYYHWWSLDSPFLCPFNDSRNLRNHDNGPEPTRWWVCGRTRLTSGEPLSTDSPCLSDVACCWITDHSYCLVLQVLTEANTIAISISGSVSGQPMGFRFRMADDCLQICRPNDGAELAA